ncbi:hypothetical protein AT728_15110 [Streptomyces silvensis]|uniref:Uncharacterized protein n=1 Tax=Streptomyces silvensis TaxID=1765722 RepID=A0A0W7X364_9ACTN|nr:hypothetical protein AT728_15110 [Streptomyces silvensis]
MPSASGLPHCRSRWNRSSDPIGRRLLPRPGGAVPAGLHPLAKKVGAWPAVLGMAGSVALASWVAVDRRD